MSAEVRLILEELRALGLDVSSVADLYNNRLDYRCAIPTLITWLSRATDPKLKEQIVRALSVKWARPDAARPMVAEFERVEDPGGLGLRWTIGSALEVLAIEELSDDLLRIARDRRYGRAREMVVLALAKLRDPRVSPTLIDLLEDDEVVGHAVIALGKLGVGESHTKLESLLGHPRSWVRSEAKRALHRINRKAGSKARHH